MFQCAARGYRICIRSALLCLWAFCAAAQGSGNNTPGATDQAAIRHVIESQLAAFARDDGVAAFAYASPGIQAKFGTADAFMEMVRTAYPSVYRPQTTEFRDLVAMPDGPVQKVLFVGPDGRAVLALYSMEREADGTWRISGCALAEAPAESA
ncbi:MAG TPA: DUF4864 domain-containing protein [Alphaproteobacteria bacterium]|nr:DUF4864 domain-containing protein [Alphaproteobacteria bacterium]